MSAGLAYRRFGAGSRISAWGAAWVPAALLLGASAAAAAVSDERGFVSDGIAGRMLFQRCGASGLAPQPLLLLDKTAGSALSAGIEAVRQVRLEPDRPLFVEFRGEAAGSVMTAHRFQRAIGHVASCNAAPVSPPAGVRVLAEGRAPDWRLLATPKATRLELVGAKPVEFSPPVLSASAGDGAVRSLTAKTSPGGPVIRVDLTEQACSDNRSETAYGARVTATLGERRLEGCAARF